MKHFKTISEFLEFRGLPKPQHPLISILHVDHVKQFNKDEPASLLFDFYSVAVKRMSNVKAKYGQQPFDFNEGIMSFMAPGQVINLSIVSEDEEIKKSGWVLYIHPDFLWNTPLAKTIRHYDFWSYSLNEGLFLSEKEEHLINNIAQNIEQEYHANIDKFSKQIIISQIETLLSYSERFYNRQFITREKSHHEVLERFEYLLDDHFKTGNHRNEGILTVQHIAEQLYLSPKYLSNLLRMLTGKNTQQHIHDRLIAQAKEKLSTTNMSVSDISYSLGFEHLQSFSKFFKTKTSLSPLEFRQSFQ